MPWRRLRARGQTRAGFGCRSAAARNKVAWNADKKPAEKLGGVFKAQPRRAQELFSHFPGNVRRRRRRCYLHTSGSKFGVFAASRAALQSNTPVKDKPVRQLTSQKLLLFLKGRGRAVATRKCRGPGPMLCRRCCCGEGSHSSGFNAGAAFRGQRLLQELSSLRFRDGRRARLCSTVVRLSSPARQ